MAKMDEYAQAGFQAESITARIVREQLARESRMAREKAFFSQIAETSIDKILEAQAKSLGQLS